VTCGVWSRIGARSCTLSQECPGQAATPEDTFGS